MSRSGPYNEDELALHIVLHYITCVTGEEDLTVAEVDAACARLQKVLDERRLLSPETQR